MKWYLDDPTCESRIGLQIFIAKDSELRRVIEEALQLAVAKLRKKRRR